MRNPIFAAVTLLAVTALLAGCASDPLADQYKEGSDKNYISGSGITEVPLAERGEPVAFEAKTDAGDAVSSDDYAGEVLVVNFWYAACPPCRVEAPDLQDLNEEFEGDGVSFLGVNVRDQAETSFNTTKEWGITYPSVVDVNDGNMLLAYAGTVAPNAVPTTLVIDKQGRVAARYLGLVESPSILRTLIKDALAEDD